MKRLAPIILIASAGIALAKPATLVTTKHGKTTLGVPKGYTAAVGERCISMDGRGSLWVFRTNKSRADFEKAEAASKGKRVAKDKVVCFEHTEPGENARCHVTTAGGGWVTQFVSFGKGFSALGGGATMQAIVESVQGWDGKPYDGTYPEGNDCPVVK